MSEFLTLRAIADKEGLAYSTLTARTQKNNRCYDPSFPEGKLEGESKTALYDYEAVKAYLENNPIKTNNKRSGGRRATVATRRKLVGSLLLNEEEKETFLKRKGSCSTANFIRQQCLYNERDVLLEQIVELRQENERLVRLLLERQQPLWRKLWQKANNYLNINTHVNPTVAGKIKGTQQ